MPTVIAIRTFEHDGRTYQRGDSVELGSTQALAYQRQQKVTLTRGAVIPRDLEAEPASTAEPVRARRRYRRRDMTAEGTTE